MRLCAFETMALATALLLAAAACGGEGDAGETPTASPYASFATSTPPSPTATSGDGGIASVEAIARGIRAQDYAALIPLIEFDPVPCAAAVGGAGGPPACRDGEAPGTLVKV